jgi:hypothetical protein
MILGTAHIDILEATIIILTGITNITGTTTILVTGITSITIKDTAKIASSMGIITSLTDLNPTVPNLQSQQPQRPVS